MKDYTKQFWELLPFLGVIKRVLLQKTYLQILPVAFGYWHLVRSKGRVHQLSIPLAAMAICGVLGPLVSADLDVSTVGRVAQLLGMVFFFSFVASKENQLPIKTLLIGVLAINLGTYILDSAWGETPWKRTVFGIVFYRLPGIVGEPNFTATLLVGLFGLALYYRLRWISVLLALSVLPTFSRAGALGLILITIVHFAQLHLPSRGFNWLPKAILFFALSSPFAAYLAFQNSSNELATALSIKSPRFYQTPAYVQLGIENPLGVGYRKGVEKIRPYVDNLQEKVKRKLIYSEQHSLYTQVFSEFGFLGYLLLAIFLFKITSFCLSHQPRLAAAWSGLIFAFVFINGLSEIIFYTVSGLIISLSVSQKKPLQSTSPTESMRS